MTARKLLLKALYWLAVLVISVALLVLLVLFFEARDSSDLEGSKQRTERGSATVAPRVEHADRSRAAVAGRA